MKCFGVAKEVVEGPKALAEATLVVSREELLELARFFEKCAEDFKSDRSADHFHFRDFWSKWKEGMDDLIVVNADS